MEDAAAVCKVASAGSAVSSASNGRFCHGVFFESAMGPVRWRKWLKVLALHAQDPIWAPVLILAAPLSFQLSACSWESSRGRPKALGPCTRMGNPEEAPGFGPA